MSKTSNNQLLLRELIKQEFDANENYTKEDDFFEFYSACQLLKKRDLSEEEIEKGILGAGNDGGCDGIYLFLNGMLVDEEIINSNDVTNDKKIEMIIIQAKRSQSFGEDVISKWKTTSNNLLQMDNNIEDFKSRYNSDVLDAFKLFRSLHIKYLRNRVKLFFEFNYVSQGSIVHPNVHSQASELEKMIRVLFPKSSVIINFVGADKLMELACETAKSDYNIQLAENAITIGERNDYIALVNLYDYYKFITDVDGNIIKNIFESNVRDYQGNVAVNAEIQETLQNCTEEDFWWLNNGITIVANEITPKTPKNLLLSFPEIVNGLQTSSEIFNYFSKFPDKSNCEKRNVLVRIMVPQNDASRDKIILATNNQTAIPKSSLRASDAIHRQIEMYFKNNGLYYDRRKNYYKNLGKRSTDIISVSFLAQCLIAILLQKPDYARARPSTILVNDDHYKKLYIDNDNLLVFYNAAIVGRKVNTFLKSTVEYTNVVRGDILFYVVFYVTAKLVGKTVIESNDLAGIDINLINDDLIKFSSKVIHEIYFELGGTSKIAKGPKLIKDVISKLEQDLVSRSL